MDWVDRPQVYTLFVWNLQLFQGFHFWDNFPLKTLKLARVALHSIQFYLRCLDFQSHQYKKLVPAWPCHVFAMGYWNNLQRYHLERKGIIWIWSYCSVMVVWSAKIIQRLVPDSILVTLCICIRLTRMLMLSRFSLRLRLITPTSTLPDYSGYHKNLWMSAKGSLHLAYGNCDHSTSGVQNLAVLPKLHGNSHFLCS